MAKVYKTPGVYIEEISLLPPSVAEVETAIPAFIGYTEKAEKNGMKLNMIPTAIRSMMDYHQYFGGAPAVTPTVALDEKNVISSVDPGENKFYMYDSLQLFFNNGGGKCYIISVGLYEEGKIDIGNDTKGLLGGLKQLEKEDEPTLILAPDAVLTDGTDLYDFQKAALAQSAKLQDRFVICDLYDGDLESKRDDFRNNIGINDLKYGAAYMPWLKANLKKNIAFRNVTIKRASTEEELQLENLTRDTDIKNFITQNLRSAIDANDDLEANIEPLISDYKSLKEKFDSLVGAYELAKDQDSLTIDKLQSSIRDLYTYLRDILYLIAKTTRDGITDTNTFKLKTDLDAMVKNANLPKAFKTLLQHNNSTIGFTSGKIYATGTANTTKLTELITALNAISGAESTSTDYITSTDSDAAIDAQYTAATDPAKKGDIARNAAISAFAAVNAVVNELIYTAQNYESKFDDILPDIFGLYKTMLSKIGDSLNVIPPSGAIAGIYAYVDSNRGVWKAPANVSLNMVVGPSTLIDNSLQDELNVDPNAGKSINAIRAFAGKGTLVWGARTLAGNDNEWRYIPVRRFYNFAEESIKKGTGWVVFEPNDANTWIRVKAMIENFLIKQWRNGALAGAKPEEAFFVKVGLGQTMTALDILEGRMNIEIGMAVVRPAEFIILKFSHLLQKS